VTHFGKGGYGFLGWGGCVKKGRRAGVEERILRSEAQRRKGGDRKKKVEAKVVVARCNSMIAETSGGGPEGFVEET